jgi:hypothetical protein
VVKSGEKVKRKSNNPAGRPVTVGASDQIAVRVSPEMHDRLRASAEAAHVSMADAVRLVLGLVIDSPADVLAAMVEDPEAMRTVFVERVAPAVRRVPAA